MKKKLKDKEFKSCTIKISTIRSAEKVGKSTYYEDKMFCAEIKFSHYETWSFCALTLKKLFEEIEEILYV